MVKIGMWSWMCPLQKYQETTRTEVVIDLYRRGSKETGDNLEVLRVAQTWDVKVSECY
jgi:hypothetical protein